MAKSYEELTFSDDFMFWKILETKPHLCKELLELVLGQSMSMARTRSRSPQKEEAYDLTFMRKMMRKSFMTWKCRTSTKAISLGVSATRRQ